MEKVKIERFNDQLEGLGYLNGKIIFVPKTKPGDNVRVDVFEEKASYLRGKVLDSTPTDCPYFYECGGCHLRHMSYEETINAKLQNFKNLLLKNKIIYSGNIDFIKNSQSKNYRNKISLKIHNSKIGYYESRTNNLVSIDKCLIAKGAINNLISDLYLLNIQNGDLVVRCNYNDELLVSIETKDLISYDFNLLKNNHKIAGIVLNGKCVLNNDYFFDKIGNYLFKVSYDSFFQVNNLCANEIFNIVDRNIDCDDIVLDLYSGVGTLSIVAAKNAKRVIGIEIVKNAVLNALVNKKINNCDNVDFMLGDVPKMLSKISIDFNTIIFDPPRSGLDKFTRSYVLEKLPDKIIYVSCNPVTLVRDLKILLNHYSIKDITLVDMFSYTYHCETICVLERK